MTEPERLLSSDATDFERQLLESVLDEQPSARLEWRMQRGLGLAGPGLWLAGAKAAVASTAGKLVSVAIVGASLAAGGSALQSYWSGGENVPVRTDSAALPAQAPAARATLNAPAVDETALEPAPSVAAATSAAESSSLREEIELLDAARKAIARGERAVAERVLQRYRQRFPEGVLRREAQILEQRTPRSER